MLKLIEMGEMEETEALIVEFDDFWAMYPRRVAKKDARRAWEKIPEKTRAVIVTALFEWRRIWLDRNEIDFIPHPATWLNGERWEDEFPAHHRPYTDRPAGSQAIIRETGEAKPMPAHVIAAMRKMRGKS